jgi:hypothetical protein
MAGIGFYDGCSNTRSCSCSRTNYLSIRVWQVFTVSDALRRTPKVTRIAVAAVDRGWVHSDRMLDGGTVRLALIDRRVPSIPDNTSTEGSVDVCVE